MRFIKYLSLAENIRDLPVRRLCCCAVLSYQVVSYALQSQTVACQAPLSLRFPRQEYWSWLPFPSPGVEPAASAMSTEL